MEYAIRKATINDLKELQAFARRTFADTYRAYNTPENMQYYHDLVFSDESFKKDLNGTTVVYYIAWETERIMGYIKLNITADQGTAGGIELERIYVSKEQKGKGLGKALVQKAAGVGREYDRQYLWLGVWERNDAAQGFYRKLGFEPFGTHVFMLGTDPQEDILMKKNLRP
ncbi:GNAT family N-acetyltransferase [Niabella beijingensis]|uniref:GNAT family N-acetyltransferase n=1 Tax=Niabella beijingensis TaxID=2872700 RepID=UPI001CBC0FD0|nr:GNAT family N-acetyltransferase [Niabella beijingensis]